MVMTMMLRMMMMRCQFYQCDVYLTLLPFVTSNKKGGVVLDMRVVILKGRELVQDILLGGVLISEGCSKDYLYLFIFSTLDTFVLVHGSCDHFDIHCTYLLYIYVDVCLFHLPLHVLLLFSLYAHASYYVYAIYYFYFTQRCLDELCLKCFRNTGYQSLFTINSLLAKFFKSLCLDRFYYIQQVNMS